MRVCSRRPWFPPVLQFLAAVVLLLVSSTVSAQLVINEFRVRGENGPNDEYIEIYNNSGADHVVAASSGVGYGVFASDGIIRCAIPNGTMIPDGGHYLCVNSVGYSLALYPAGSGTTATPDATYTTDILENAGIAIFTTTVPADATLATRMDAAGSTSEANALYKEGAGYPAIVPFSLQHAFYRDNCGKGGSITTLGPCPSGGFPVDTNNNAADFIYVERNGTSAGAGQRLGAPGPETSLSPIYGTGSLVDTPLDDCAAETARPNVDYYGFSQPPNATFGRLEFRRTFTNNTGAPLERLRFRIIDLTTFPAPAGFADMRALSSTDVTVRVDRTPCGSGTSDVTVLGTTFEDVPAQANGGAFNSTWSAGTVTLATPLPNGASIDLRFTVGLQQHGVYKLGLISESLPGGNALYEVDGCTDGCTGELEVVHTDPIETNPALEGSTLDFRVTFNRLGAINVDASDFTVTTTGTIAGAAITNVVQEPAQGGINYIVTVNAGTGAGTIRLDVVDDGSITAAGDMLGGVGAGNGDFSAGEEYIIVGAAPVVASSVRADPDPVAAPASVDFTVTFSEPVTGVDASDFALTTTGTVNAAIAGVAGAGSVYTVTVTILSGAGTLRLDVVDDDTIVDGDGTPLGGPGAGNGSFTGGEVYTVFEPAEIAAVPALDEWMLGALAALLAAVAFVALRR